MPSNTQIRKAKSARTIARKADEKARAAYNAAEADFHANQTPETEAAMHAAEAAEAETLAAYNAADAHCVSLGLDPETEAAEKSTDEKSTAPIATDATPETLTHAARHAAKLQAAYVAGCDPTQLRGRYSYAVALSGPKAQQRHAPSDNYAKRYSCVTPQTQRFVSRLHAAFGHEPFDAAPHDAGKLARALGNGLLRVVSGAHPCRTKTGLPAIGPSGSEPMQFAVIKPDCDFTF